MYIYIYIYICIYIYIMLQWLYFQLLLKTNRTTVLDVDVDLYMASVGLFEQIKNGIVSFSRFAGRCSQHGDFLLRSQSRSTLDGISSGQSPLGFGARPSFPLIFAIHPSAMPSCTDDGNANSGMSQPQRRHNHPQDHASSLCRATAA